MGKDVRKEIISLMENIEESWYDISILLYHIYKENLYERWGYDKFSGYVENELSISYRDALFRRQIGEAIVKYALDKELVTKVGGWLKFKEITYLFHEGMKNEDFEKLINKVEPLTHEETKELVKNERHGKFDEKIGIRIFKFRTTDDQAVNIDMAISDAMELIGTNNPALALELICIEFSLNKSNGISTEILEFITDKKEEPMKRKEPAHKGKKKNEKGIKTTIRKQEETITQ